MGFDEKSKKEYSTRRIERRSENEKNLPIFQTTCVVAAMRHGTARYNETRQLYA